MDWVTTSTVLAELRGDEAASAWERFVASFRKPVASFAQRCGLNAADAEDVAQETLTAFVEALRAGRYDRERGRLGKWLLGIAWRQILRERERAARRDGALAAVGGESSMEQAAAPADEIAAIWDLEWDMAALELCLGAARDEFRPATYRAFELVVLVGCSPEHAAVSLGVPIRTVYNAKHRVTKRVRELREELEATTCEFPEEKCSDCG